jgi:cyclic pyranopterin phosphate synthase
VNTVAMRGINDGELTDIVDHCDRLGVHTVKMLDVIKDLPSGSESFSRRLALRRGKTLEDLYMPLDGLLHRYRGLMVATSETSQGGLGHPMSELTLPSGMKLLIKDSRAGAWYGSLCGGCRFYPCHDALMAVRLTADAKLQYCLLREDVTAHSESLETATPKELERRIVAALEIYGGAQFKAPTPNAGRSRNDVAFVHSRARAYPLEHPQG